MKLRKLLSIVCAVCLLMAVTAAFPLAASAADAIEVFTSTDLVKDTCGTGISIKKGDYGVTASDDSVRWAARFDYCLPVDLDGLRMVFSDVEVPESGQFSIGFGGSETGAWVDGNLALFMMTQKGGKFSVAITRFKGLSPTKIQSDEYDMEVFGKGKTVDLVFKRLDEDEWALYVNGTKVTFDHKDTFADLPDINSVYPVLGMYGSGGAWSLNFESLTCNRFAKDIEKVEKAIKSIGTVVYTDDCNIAIGEARAMYNALGKHLRSGVSNLSVLEAAEKKYEELSKAPTTTQKPITTKPVNPGTTKPPVKDGPVYWHNNEFNVHLSAKADADLLAVSTDVAQAAKDAFGRLGTVAAAYDVQLKKGNAAVAGEGKMLLRLPVENGANAVLMWDGTKAVEIPAVTIGNFLCAAVDSTGVYAVAAVTREIPETPNTGESVWPVAAAVALLGSAAATAMCLSKKERA